MLLGPSGSGKTTLLQAFKMFSEFLALSIRQALAGRMSSSDSGTICINGKAPNASPKFRQALHARHDFRVALHNCQLHCFTGDVSRRKVPSRLPCVPGSLFDVVFFRFPLLAEPCEDEILGATLTVREAWGSQGSLTPSPNECRLWSSRPPFACGPFLQQSWWVPKRHTLGLSFC